MSETTTTWCRFTNPNDAPQCKCGDGACVFGHHQRRCDNCWSLTHETNKCPIPRDAAPFTGGSCCDAPKKITVA